MINGYANVGGPRPLGVSKEMWNWAQQYAQHLAFCHEYFGGKADNIITQSKRLASESPLGNIQALDVCMQIEAEFPGRIEEIVESSFEHPQGALIGLSQYITHLRNNG